MTDNAGVMAPSVFRNGIFGDRYLGVIPVARGIVVGNTLVVLVAIERFTARSMLTVRAMLQEESAELKSGGLAWPSLRMSATDDAGRRYRIRGTGGNGTTADYEISFGIMPALSASAKTLSIELEEITWSGLDSCVIGSPIVGPRIVTVDLANEEPARMA